MHCLTVTYPLPEDPQAFREHYINRHLPLARSLPGLLRASYAFPEALGPSSEPPYCIFQAYFDDAAAMANALSSPQGAAVAADVANYSPQLSHFDIHDL